VDALLCWLIVGVQGRRRGAVGRRRGDRDGWGGKPAAGVEWGCLNFDKPPVLPSAFRKQQAHDAKTKSPTDLAHGRKDY